jgi:hypothetical protein
MRSICIVGLAACVSLSSCENRVPQPEVEVEVDPQAPVGPAVGPAVGPTVVRKAPVPASWEGPLPSIPTRVSPVLTPRKILVTSRLDKKAAHRRLGELALAAFKEIAGMALPDVRAEQMASLCQRVGPYVTVEVVDRLVGATFLATQKVAPAKLQNAYDHLVQCLTHAGDATRARILPALLARAATAKDLSVFSWPFNSARHALEQLTAGQVEPIVALAQRLLMRAQTYYHKEHLLAGLAAAGTVLPPARAQGLLARAERGVAGAAFKESRPIFLGELALTWVAFAARHPALLDRAVGAILRLPTSPYARAKALGKLVELPGFSGSKQAPAVLKLLGREAAKLPATEKIWLQRKLIEQAARVVGGLPLLESVITAADPANAYRARVIATRALAVKNPRRAIVHAGAALDLVDKLPKESRRNWRQAPLFRALKKVEPMHRQPLLARIEKRAAGFKNKYFTAWTLRKIIELHGKSNPGEVRRLQPKMMAAVAGIAKPARRVRALRGIYKLQLSGGPAAAPTVMDQALKLSEAGVGAWVWGRFLRPLGKRPLAERKRWLPRLLGNIVRQSSTWQPRELARWSRLVARLAPQVLSPAEAEALMLRTWAAVERAAKRSGGVETKEVVNALRALGAGLAKLGSVHFATLVRRMEARIPRRKAWSEHLMSYVAALGALLPPADAGQLHKRMKGWVALGGKDTRLMRRGAIVAGLVASHGGLNRGAIRGWLAQGTARLSWRPMVQFLIRLPLADLETKAAALPSRQERLRMYSALIRATVVRAKRTPRSRRRNRRRQRRNRRR